MLRRAGQRGADALILNLEDGRFRSQDFARGAVARALEGGELGACERIVRINPIGSATGYRDLLAIARLLPDAILLPKVRDPEEVRFADWTIERLEAIHDLRAGGIGLMCMIESAAGVLEARRIAGSSERVRALIFGAADFAEDAGVPASADRSVLAPVLMQIVLAARAAGVAAIDAPHMRLDDPEGLAAQARLARDLRFRRQVGDPPGADSHHQRGLLSPGRGDQWAHACWRRFPRRRRWGDGRCSAARRRADRGAASSGAADLAVAAARSAHRRMRA
jgi:citrate lyase subunit beta/citryl-CoA lyase